MANPWFRMYSEFMHDPKVQMLSEQNQRRLIMIFCMRCNDNVTLQDKYVTFTLRISDEEWQVTKSIFIEHGFIDIDNNVLNWDKRQYISDSSASRVAKHRALHKTVTTSKSNVTVTSPEQIQNRTDTETDNSKDASSASDDKKTKSAKPVSAIEMLLALGVEEQAAKDWLTVRKAKRAPLTETALNELKTEAAKAGITVGDAIEICAKKSWQGFNASWNWKDEAVKRGTPKPENFASRNYGEGIQKL